MKHLQRLSIFLIVLALVTTLTPGSVLTAHAEGEDDFQTRDDGPSSVIITGYTGTAEELSIPGEIGGKTVAAIESLGDNSTLTTIHIPPTLTSISDGAFSRCKVLASIIVEGGTYFSSDQGVLYNLDKTALLQYPAKKADATFSIPAGVATISAGAFAGSTLLADITADPANAHFSDNGGVLYSEDGMTLVQYPSGKTEASFTIPQNVTIIQSMAFSGNPFLTKVTIPLGVTNMGDRAFSGCASLSEAKFGGNAPSEAGQNLFDGAAAGFKLLCPAGAAGWDAPLWNAYTLETYQFNVTFDLMHDELTSEIDVDFNAILSAPETPDWPGHKLEGWYEQDPNDLWNFEEDTITADTTLHAKWNTERLTVKWELHDGSEPTGSQTDYDTALTEPDEPSQDGYYFTGWYREAACENLWDFEEKVTADITLHAGWTAIIPVEISCVKTDVKLYGEKTGTITATATGGNSAAYEYAITGVADWQEAGLFNSLGAGTYTVIARDKAHPENSKSIQVSITQPNLIKYYTAGRMPSTANTATAIAIIEPAPQRGYTKTSITYISSNPAVASASQNGIITFLSSGRARIYVTLASQTIDKRGRVISKKTSYSRTITVYQPALTLALNTASAEVLRTKSIKLYATVDPNTTSNKRVSWYTSDRRIATVSSSGTVTGRGVGTVVITCRTRDGSNLSASCTVQVNPIQPTGIRITRSSISVAEGSSYRLKTYVYPSNTDFKGVSWSSGDPMIASVDTSGRVWAYTSGTTVITARTTNGYTYSTTVSVYVKPLSSYGKLSTKGMSTAAYQAAINAVWTKATPEGTGEIEPIDLTHDYSYDDLARIMKNLAKNDDVTLDAIGSTAQGRTLYSLKVDYSPGPGKKIILLTGQIHAREFAGSVYILKQLSELMERAKTDATIRTLLENITFITIPVVNPDGRELSRVYGQLRKSNANGVDLGRNFPSVNAGQLAKGMKGSYETKPGWYYYPGPNLGSEKEVQAVMKWMQTYVPKAACLIDYHQMGHQVYGGKPWDTAANEANNMAFSVNIRDYLNGDRTTGRYVYQPEYANYGRDGSGGSLTDHAMSIAAGMQFSGTYGRMTLATGGRELPLLIFRDLDRYTGRYTTLNPGFMSATLEIGKGYDYLGYSQTARNLMAQEYTDYHYSGLLEFISGIVRGD